MLGQASDEPTRLALTEAAYRDVVASGRYTYRGFAAQVDDALLTMPERAGGLRGAAVRRGFGTR